MKKQILCIITLLICALYAQDTTATPESSDDPALDPVPDTTIVSGSQVYLFTTDQLQQGYYNRPYERYEAEPGYCTTNGTFLPKSDVQTTIQSEASHQQAVQLIAAGDYVSWVVNKAGDGLTVRFSLPDGASGEGTTGTVDIYAGSDKVGSLTLNSYWAWQYCSDNYPTNNPSNGPLVRMKFDETHLRLSRAVASGETLKIVKTGTDSLSYTIDFAELEPIPAPTTFADLSDTIRYPDLVGLEKLQYSTADGDIAEYIKNNQGKAIYIPEGTYNAGNRIYIYNKPNTKIIGAGMWYTEIYFNKSSEDATTYAYRGIECTRNNTLIEGLYLNTVNRQRYMNGNDSKQVGKAFQGGFGTNSIIRNCWAEHFECGGWIADYSGSGSNNLLVEHCRFRNNYADGLNCAHGAVGNTIRFCSFRNNGDDDMASWSTLRQCSNITFEYCTAENNWRASSLGFFGGKNHEAHHIAIFDGLECGARVNADFSGTGFSGTISIHDVTIEHCGTPGGSKGTTGDFWGNTQGAFNIGSTNYYAIPGVHLQNITIRNSRTHALYLRAQGGKKVTDLQLYDITVDTTPGYGIYYSGIQGDADYCHLSFINCAKGNCNNHMPTFVITDCDSADVALEEVESLPVITSATCIYDAAGRLMAVGDVSSLPAGYYILVNGDDIHKCCIRQ